jgi:outer membrane biosynthesis protein TonB
MSRKASSSKRGPFIGSLVVHVALLALFWSSTVFRPEPILFESFAIQLYSPPPAVEAEAYSAPQEELVVERPPEQPPPEPAPPEPKPEVRPEEPPPRREPEPRAETPRPQPTTPPDPQPERQPARGPDAVPSSAGGENINVRMEGLRRDYPEYYNNIVRQITRCFRPPREGRWETTVQFVIGKDGALVGDPTLAKRSGNVGFDILAMGAVECAGGRFGEFPTDLALDRLAIQFTFTPAGAGGP